MAYQHCYKAIAYRWHFPPKQAWITDEFHPQGILADVTPAPGRTYTKQTWPPRGRGRGESLTSPRRIEAKRRAAQVVHMRWQGCTWQQIADALGFKDRSGAWRACRRIYDQVDRERQRRRK